MEIVSMDSANPCFSVIVMHPLHSNASPTLASCLFRKRGVAGSKEIGRVE